VDADVFTHFCLQFVYNLMTLKDRPTLPTKEMINKLELIQSSVIRYRLLTFSLLTSLVTFNL